MEHAVISSGDISLDLDFSEPREYRFLVEDRVSRKYRFIQDIVHDENSRIVALFGFPLKTEYPEFSTMLNGSDWMFDPLAMIEATAWAKEHGVLRASMNRPN